jgi:hypothetical protein
MVPVAPPVRPDPMILLEPAINGLGQAAAVCPSGAAGRRRRQGRLTARMWHLRNNGSHLRSQNCKFAFRSAAICLK